MIDLYFEDMAIYSFVKNNTFNGIGLPSFYLMDKQGDCSLAQAFGYQDFKEIIMMDSPKEIRAIVCQQSTNPIMGLWWYGLLDQDHGPFKEKLLKSF